MTTVTREQIADHLRKLGLRRGDDVVVHSSLKSFGRVDGGADAVIDAILDVIGEPGTLLVPNSVFGGSVTVFLRQTREVDLRTAPSLLGVITERVRLWPGAIRSIHPTHPVAAIGRSAQGLLGEHHLGDSPTGAKSPYGKLATQENGRVLLIGVSNRANTMLHTAEEYWAPYIFVGETFRVRTTATTGDVHAVTVKGYCVGRPRNFPAIDPFLENAGVLRTGTIGQAAVTLIDAPGMMQIAHERLQADPEFLLKLEEKG